jgi:hypothetical protein
MLVLAVEVSFFMLKFLLKRGKIEKIIIIGPLEKLLIKI